MVRVLPARAMREREGGRKEGSMSSCIDVLLLPLDDSGKAVKYSTPV